MRRCRACDEEARDNKHRALSDHRSHVCSFLWAVLPHCKRLILFMSMPGASSAGSFSPINLSDLKEKAGQDRADDQQGGRQPFATELQFGQEVLAALQTLLCDDQS